VLRRRGGVFDRMWRLQADSLVEAMRMDAAE
jgi:ATP-binding cassette subfamily B protein